MSLDERIQTALEAGIRTPWPTSADLFTRVQLSIADDRRLTRAAPAPSRRAVVRNGQRPRAVVVATIDRREGDLIMDWWILELIWFAGMVGLALWLGPFIRRFGKAYAADVFRANPRTGKSFIVLMDVAYYLIFFAYIMFTVQFEPAARLGEHGERQPTPGVDGEARGHPVDRRSPARPQRADAPGHGPPLHAQSTPR